MLYASHFFCRWLPLVFANIDGEVREMLIAETSALSNPEPLPKPDRNTRQG
jgi:hypothetical protein